MKSRALSAALVQVAALASLVVGGASTPAGAQDGAGEGWSSSAAEGAAAAGAAGAASESTGASSGAVEFSVPSGTFSGALSVSLSTPVTGAEIRYTTDGAVPDADSPLYQGRALRLTTTTQLRALPVVAGEPAGSVATALYVLADVATTHDLPVVVLDDYGAGAPGRDLSVGTAVLTFAPGTSLSGTPTLVSRGGIHLRGQSSARLAKKGYRLELWDDRDKDADLPFLGMPQDGDWILRGPFLDKALIRDAFSYTLGQKMGLRAPRYRFCEVYLNLDGDAVTSADYMGVYVASEKIEASDDRLDIADLKSSDVTSPAVEGGYVIKFDQSVAEEPLVPCTGASSTCWRYLEIVEPGSPEPEQVQWLAGYIQAFHDALHSADFADPQDGYAAWIDVDSFVDDVIINELSRNQDAYTRSAFFFKDRGGKLTAGPLWDYELDWGTGGLRHNLDTAGWQYQEQYRSDRVQDWFVRLFEDPAFVARVVARWQGLRGGVLSDGQLDALMDDVSAPLTAASERNFTRWPILTTQRFVIPWAVTPTVPTWQQQVEQMRTWTHARAAWLDTQWG